MDFLDNQKFYTFYAREKKIRLRMLEAAARFEQKTETLNNEKRFCSGLFYLSTDRKIVLPRNDQ